jgi:hypothetical protein
MTTPTSGVPGIPQTPLTGGAAAAGPTQTTNSGLINTIANQAQARVNAATSALAINNQTIVPTHGVTNTGLVNPPPMKTFVYSPQVRVVIGTRAGPQVDVSPDVVRCTLIRPENSAASFQFTLHNKGLQYTPKNGRPIFSRMDRVVVYMKRINWLQVFSGYVDTMPYVNLYPGEITFKCTCTLKRLKHTWFNPALPNSQRLLSQYSALQNLQGDGQAGIDSGLGSIIRRLLQDAGGWNASDIHIQNFPMNFYNFIKTQVAQSNSMTVPAVQALQQSVLGSDLSPGPGAYAGSSPNAGQPGPQIGAAGSFGWATSFTDTTTAFYVTQIVQACDNHGMGPSPSQNNLGAGLSQAGTMGAAASAASYGSQGNAQAWQDIHSLGASIQQANRNADGAILGVACALVETGGGTTIRNLANNSVPQSVTFPNDGLGTNGTSCGIFQQQNSAQWGNVAQRMNPLQAANMFFAALGGVQGWQQMDPGQAIQQVQLSADGSGVTYDAAIQLATSIVQAYRTSTANAAGSGVAAAGPAAGSTVPASAATVSAGGIPSVNGGVVGAATSGVTPSGVVPGQPAQPQPNSEGAINFCIQQAMGHPFGFNTNGPATYDAPGLISAAFQSIGVFIPAQTGSIASSVPPVPQNALQRGDLIMPDTNHVAIWMGDGTIIESVEPTGVRQIPNPYGAPGTWSPGAYRACLNGGPNPAAPYNPPWTMGPGTPPSAIQQQGGPIGTGSSGSAEPIAKNIASLFFTGSQYATQYAVSLPPDRVFLDGEPLLNMVRAVCQASLRCFSSAPDGSFMAWYPDYFGIDGKPAVLSLADIELKDLHVDFSDDPMTTHAFVAGDYSMVGEMSQWAGWLSTAGVVSVEQPWLYYRLVAGAPTNLDTELGPLDMEQIYGIRPLQHVEAVAGSRQLEFIMACQLFMQKWAEQYQTQVTMTFMPELFPGMRVALPDHQLQVYVTSVTHVCDYAQGFQTQATIMAPSNPLAKDLMAAVNYATADVGGNSGINSMPAYIQAILVPGLTAAYFGQVGKIR